MSRRTKRHKRRAEWLLFIMIALDWTPERCRQRYRKRFGVETSYRLGDERGVATTSPNPAYRFVLIGLGFLLLNLWVHLCWIYTQVAHRGRRAFAPSLRQARFLNFLGHALERIYGTVNRIRAPAARWSGGIAPEFSGITEPGFSKPGERLSGCFSRGATVDTDHWYQPSLRD